MGRKASDSPNLQVTFSDSAVKLKLFDLAEKQGFSTLKDWLEHVSAQGMPDMAETAQLPEIAQSIASFIDAKKPFTIAYSKATGEIEQYSLLYAEIVHRGGDESSRPGGSWYLEGYCDTPNPKAELPELAHNRTFLIDRLEDAISAPGRGKWHKPGLQTIDIVLQLSGGLAHNYKPLEGRDLPDRDKWLDATTREVVWRCNSVLWAKRPILRYGASCKVIGPANFRDLVIQEIAEMVKNYQ